MQQIVTAISKTPWQGIKKTQLLFYSYLHGKIIGV